MTPCSTLRAPRSPQVGRVTPLRAASLTETRTDYDDDDETEDNKRPKHRSLSWGRGLG